MQIEIRFRGIESSPRLREHVVRRIEIHLGRFDAALAFVRVRVEDVNGPKGGVDKRCQFELRGRRFGAAIIEERSDDEWAAVGAAALRAGRTVARLLGRAAQAGA